MSLLARVEAALVERHARNVVMAAARNHQTPGHPCVTTKGATMAQDERAGVTSGTEPISGGELHGSDSDAPVGPHEPTLAQLANELEDAQRRYRDAFNRRAS